MDGGKGCRQALDEVVGCSYKGALDREEWRDFVNRMNV